MLVVALCPSGSVSECQGTGLPTKGLGGAATEGAWNLEAVHSECTNLKLSQCAPCTVPILVWLFLAGLALNFIKSSRDNGDEKFVDVPPLYGHMQPLSWGQSLRRRQRESGALPPENSHVVGIVAGR